MNFKPPWLLLLLTISAGVWSVPIERNEVNPDVKEEGQEESMVISNVWSFLSVIMFT